MLTQDAYDELGSQDSSSSDTGSKDKCNTTGEKRKSSARKGEVRGCWPTWILMCLHRPQEVVRNTNEL